MTLPFRRRHNDAEDTHDRARALSSRRFLESLEADEEAWLSHHLDACTECRRDDEAFAADRELLRSLRDKPIEPPRDLWAKTAAALDFAATKRSPPVATPIRPFSRTVPLGAAAGVLVLLVLIGAALLPGVIPSSQQSPGPVAGASLPPGPTPITVAAAPVGILRPGANGTFDFSFTDIDAVCPRARPECVPPPTEHGANTVDLLGANASTVTLSPHNDQLVFESGTGDAGKIIIQPVATTQPSQAPETPGESVPPSTPTGSTEPTPIPTPAGQIEIASGVTVVGEVAYSPDGQWLAFSAAPKDGSTGPDLYVYSVGSSTAKTVTDDHQTYFSAWLGSKVLASHIELPSSDAGSSGSPRESKAPGANGQGNGKGQPMDGHPSSFLFDPASGARTDLEQADIWMPVVDPTSRFVAYWSGALRSADGVTWQLGDGQLVLDGWLDTTAAPSASAATVGPAGHPTPIVPSHVEDFVARFDPAGIRLALWVSEHADSADGRLHLVVIDPATGSIRANRPLSGEPALRRFSIDANRLAWVSPSGQDGQESSLQVLGWSGDTFGEIHSEPSANLLILR
jgi:WD40-like Beta Propeller Repeat